jgi:hypothetical protein
MSDTLDLLKFAQIILGYPYFENACSCRQIKDYNNGG